MYEDFYNLFNFLVFIGFFFGGVNLPNLCICHISGAFVVLEKHVTRTTALEDPDSMAVCFVKMRWI